MERREEPKGREICAILILDQEGQDRLNAFHEALQASGLPTAKVYAHITLAHFHDIDAEALIAWTDNFLQNKRPFEVSYDKIGELGTCLVFLPAESPELESWYEEYHERFDEHCDHWTSADRGLWTPHSSLTCEITESRGREENLARLKAAFKPFKARVVRLDLSEITPQGFDILYTKELAEA